MGETMAGQAIKQMTTTPAAAPDKDEALGHANAGRLDSDLKQILGDVLGIASEQAAAFGAETGLFGHLPELDSMAVAGLLTEIEDRLGIVIEDDDVDGEMLETYGALLGFVEAKIASLHARSS